MQGESLGMPMYTLTTTQLIKKLIHTCTSVKQTCRYATDVAAHEFMLLVGWPVQDGTKL